MGSKGGHHSEEHCGALPAAAFVNCLLLPLIPYLLIFMEPLIWMRPWGVGGQGQLAREENAVCMVEPQLCVNREVCKRTHLVCTRYGKSILNVSEIGVLFTTPFIAWSKGGEEDSWRKQALGLKISLEHVIYTFVTKLTLLVLVIQVFSKRLCLQYWTRHGFREVLKVLTHCLMVAPCKKLMEIWYKLFPQWCCSDVPSMLAYALWPYVVKTTFIFSPLTSWQPMLVVSAALEDPSV